MLQSIGVATIIWVAGTAILLKEATGLKDQIRQFVAPFATDVSLEEPGTYGVFLEYNSTVGAKYYGVPDDYGRDLRCRVVSLSSGKELDLVASPSKTKYRVNGRRGRSLWEFQVPRPGIFKISVNHSSLKDDRQFVIGIWGNPGRKVINLILGTFFVFGLGIVLAISYALMINGPRKS